MRLFLIAYCLCSFIFLYSCSSPKNPKKTSQLTPFKGFPHDIDGCSCYFSSGEEDFKDDKYLFISNLDSTAYISVNGKTLQLRLTRSTREHGTMDERDYQESYSDGMYTVVVNIRFKGHVSDEVWWNTGDIKLYFKDVEIEAISLLGECGC